MHVELICHEQGCRLVFAGRLTVEFAHYAEDRIIEALRRFRSFEVDLSAVSEIDHCGVHLLDVLRTIGGAAVSIVASSPAVDSALALPPGVWSRGVARAAVTIRA